MANKIKLRRGNKSNMPLLEEAELAYVKDEQKVYVGTSSGNKELGSGGGSVDIATKLEAEAGTDNTKMMTPLRTKQSVDVEVADFNEVLDLILGDSTGSGSAGGGSGWELLGEEEIDYDSDKQTLVIEDEEMVYLPVLEDIDLKDYKLIHVLIEGGYSVSVTFSVPEDGMVNQWKTFNYYHERVDIMMLFMDDFLIPRGIYLFKLMENTDLVGKIKVYGVSKQ